MHQKDTSWQSVKGWYHKLVGSNGHYYHEHVVIPRTLELLKLDPTNSVVDLGCGQGILSHHIPVVHEYLGLDSAPGLISAAREHQPAEHCAFEVADVARPLRQQESRFTHAVIMLALQNMQHPATALQNAAVLLVPQGKLLIVLNHPCFRIPRQSGWGVDEKSKQQYRWINRYLSSLKIPITMHPGRQQSAVTWSFHHSLQDYSEMLFKAGFTIKKIEEWTSDKQSEGKAAKMENRSRSEIPLFMAIVAEKK
jgi:ubiquinone/menaquinone biosynthesis C-methylase UbiE